MAQSLAYTAEMQAPRTRFRWVVLGLIFAIYTVASADRANIGIALPTSSAAHDACVAGSRLSSSGVVQTEMLCSCSC